MLRLVNCPIPLPQMVVGRWAQWIDHYPTGFFPYIDVEDAILKWYALHNEVPSDRSN